MTDTATDIPEHIRPQALYDMKDDALEKLLKGIRERRLSAVRHYEEAQKAAKEASDERARETLMKQCDMCTNNIMRVNKALDALETRVNKMRALRLELGID